MKKITVSIVVIALALAACKTGKKTTEEKPAAKLDCTGKAYTFIADIKPVMDQYCVRCHNTNMKAGYNFQDEAYVKKAASSGDLLGTIKHERGHPAMPAGGEQLDQSVINKIECWINNGMK
jgi:cytochrome c5